MLKGFTHARLACGCRIGFREGVEGSPVTVVVDEKGPGCPLALHVRDLPLFDHREALRPSTRLLPPEETHIEAIIHASQLPAQAVASILLTLELRSLVRQFPGKFFARC